MALAPVQGAVAVIEEGPRSGMRVFARHILPGEIALARLDRVKRRYAQATLVELLEADPARLEPDCPKADLCGGCSWRHVPDGMQLDARASFVRDALARVFGSELPALRVLPHPAPGAARARARFVLTGDGLAFRAHRSRHAVFSERCPALDEGLEERREDLARFLLGGGAEGATVLVQRGLVPGTEEWALFVSVRLAAGLHGSDRAFRLKRRRPLVLPPWLAGLRVLHPRSGPPIEFGSERFEWPLPGGVAGDGEARVTLPVGGFSQADPAGNAMLVQEVARSMRELEPSPRRGLELFCGAGNLAAAWPPGLEALRAVELDARALSYVEGNAGHLGDASLETTRADLRAGLPAGAGEGVDTALLDPPREGARAVAAELAELGPRHVVYVSCDPATLARDASLLAGAGYRPVRVAALDLFGATPHVETVLTLSRE